MVKSLSHTKSHTKFIFAAALLLFTFSAILQSQAVELLVSGDFETPVGQPDINGWDLQEFVTPGGGGGPINNTAQSSTFTPEAGARNLFLLPFSGNGALTPDDGNFDSSNLPAGDVDGSDFLSWQRGQSPTPGSQADLQTWEANYGRVGGLLTNAILSQTVPGTPGEDYTFSGYARWEEGYSGGAGTLEFSSPLGPVASPTTNAFTLEFLDAGDSVIGSRTVDLATNGQTTFNLWQQHIVTETAPVGTTNIRVTADARDMVFNVGPLQAAFYDSFSLTGAGDPDAELLANSGLEDPPPSALNFWTLTEDPSDFVDILRTAAFASRPASGGALGVWLSPFFGSHPAFSAGPVDGTMEQTAGIVPGAEYTFSGWSRFEANYSGGVDIIDAASPGFEAGNPSPTQTLIALEFLDQDGAVISTSTIDVKAERQAVCAGGDANDQACGPDADGWTPHTLAAVAPLGAVEARLIASMIDGVFNIDPQQSAFFDDFSLIGPAPLAAVATVPEPAACLIFVMGALCMLGIRKGRAIDE